LKAGEGLTLKTSAFNLFTVANLSYSTPSFPFHFPTDAVTVSLYKTNPLISVADHITFVFQAIKTAVNTLQLTHATDTLM